MRLTDILTFGVGEVLLATVLADAGSRLHAAGLRRSFSFERFLIGFVRNGSGLCFGIY